MQLHDRRAQGLALPSSCTSVRGPLGGLSSTSSFLGCFSSLWTHQTGTLRAVPAWWVHKPLGQLIAHTRQVANHVPPDWSKQGAKGWWENAVHQLLNKEVKTPKASRSQAFLPKPSAVPPATTTSRAMPRGRPHVTVEWMHTGGVAVVTALQLVSNTQLSPANPSALQLSFTNSTHCAGTRASARAQCPQPRENDTWREHTAPKLSDVH